MGHTYSDPGLGGGLAAAFVIGAVAGLYPVIRARPSVTKRSASDQLVVLMRCAATLATVPSSIADGTRLRPAISLVVMPNKFVIYGQSRSGSTLLVDLINAHPDVHCDGEVLNADAGYLKSRIVLKAIRVYPLPYLQYRRWRFAEKDYGVKLFSYHPRFGSSVLSRLQQTGWKFLHVRRRDVVRQALSSIIAGKTGHYHRRKDSEEPSYTVSITTEELDKELAKRDRWASEELEMIRGIDHLDLHYEDDLARAQLWPSAMARVSTYLEITAFDVTTPSLRPTDDRTLGEVIENYDHLEQHLNRRRRLAEFGDCTQGQ